MPYLVTEKEPQALQSMQLMANGDLITIKSPALLC